jgi:hypothetical protein
MIFLNEDQLRNHLENHIKILLNLQLITYLKDCRNNFYKIEGTKGFYTEPDINIFNELAWSFHSMLGVVGMRDDIFPLDEVTKEYIYDYIDKR